MTIALTGTGGAFTRIGLQAGLMNALNTWRKTTVKGYYDDLHAQFLTLTENTSSVPSGLYTNWTSLETAMSVAPQYLKSMAQSTLLEMVQDDIVLSDTSLSASVVELIRQMTLSADSVLQPTVTTTVTAGAGGSNVGDGTLIASVLGPNGIQMDYVIPETLFARCTKDSQSVSGATPLGKEKFQVVGANLITDFTSQDFPQGSGANLTMTAVTPDDSAVQTTCLVANGNMESFSVTNIPDNWIVDTGVVGTNILQYTASPYRGSSALQFAGTGGTAGSIYQTFNTSGQSTAKLAPLTVYAFNCWLKVSATPAAGVFSAALTDGTGTIITDANSVNNNITLSLTGVSTTYVKVSGFFRTPLNLPSAVRLRIQLSTDITSGKSCYIDDVCLQQATQLYPGGPYAAIFSGATKFVSGGFTPQVQDIFKIVDANNYITLGKFQFALDRFFGMRNLGLQIPSSGSNTINENLVTT